MQTMHHQMDGAFFCILPAQETSFFLPCRAYRNTVRTGSWAVEIMDFLTMTMPSSLLIKTAHFHTPIWRPLFHCQLPSGLQSHRQFPISYPWPMGQKTQVYSQVGVPREPCFPTCQLTRPGNIVGNGEQSECTVGGGDVKGSWEQTAGRLLIFLILLILLSTALVPVCFEPPHRHLSNSWGPPWKWEAGGKQRWLGLWSELLSSPQIRMMKP